MRAGGVVVLPERIELRLQLEHRCGTRSGGEPPFQGLVKPLDLALSLRVVGSAILLPDVQGGEDVLEFVASAAVAGGVDAAVVGQGRRGRAVGLDGGEEGVHHVAASDGPVGGAAEQQAGVVIEPVQDLHVRSVGQAPVSEVGLPGLVGLRGLEPDVGALWAFAGLGSDQPGGVQDAADRGCRRGGESFLPQMPGDRDRAGIGARRDQHLPQLHDPITNPVGDRVRAGQRGPGSGVEPVKTFVPVAGEEPMEILPRHPMFGRGRGDRHLPGDDLQHHDTMLRRHPPLSPMTRLTCRRSPVAYVANPHTSRGTM